MSARKRKDGRLSLRVDDDLLKRMKKFCERKDTTITSFVQGCFRTALEVEEANKNLPIDADQI